ncbi:MAG: DnaA regulatory inactivator Hda [Acidiferrobacterales bacterium]|nr:DnaA regulatory inactivator Hda [Acidiferrobacterales bacterium]
MTKQTVVPVRLSNPSTFGNFLPGENLATLSVLHDFLECKVNSKVCHLWGPMGTGKTHLLLAVANVSDDSIYLPLMELNLDPSCLDELSRNTLVCLDDVHSIAAQPAWENALFDLFERIENQNQRLLVSSRFRPADMRFSLKDLVNRFQGRQSLKLDPLSNENLAKLLERQAARRGLTIEESAIQFILSRFSRDVHSLMRLLNEIDTAVETRRKVTIPFLRRLIEFRLDST